MAAVGTNAVDVLMRDHRLVEQLFLQLDAALAGHDHAEQRELADQILTALSVHTAIEEEVLYPAARGVPDAAGLVDRSLADHEELEALLAGLDGRQPGDPGFEEGFRRAGDLVAEHVGEEEGELFPTLRRSMPDDELVALGDRLAEVRAAVPGRPRRASPVAAVADAASSIVDKARDAFRSITG